MRLSPVRSLTLLAAPASALALCLSLGGCFGERAAYPDPTTDTKIRADEIRADAVNRSTAIDTDLVQREREYDFRAGQVKDRNLHERSLLDLERDRKVQPLDAQDKAAKATSDRELAAIDADTAAKLKVVDGTEATKLQADAASRRAVAVQHQAEATAKLTADRNEYEATNRDKRQGIDASEAKELAVIQKEREESQRKARADKLAIDAEATKRLDGLGKDSKKRMDKSSDLEADRLENERSTDQAIRKVLDNDRAKTGDVAFTTNRGAITLRGAVADEATHRDIVARITKISGVVTVEDLLTIR